MELKFKSNKYRKLGKLEQINLRDIWKHEAIDFTNGWQKKRIFLCC